MRHVPAHFDGEKVVLDGPGWKKRGRESLFGKASLLGHHLRTLNDRHPSKLARHLFRDGG